MVPQMAQDLQPPQPDAPSEPTSAAPQGAMQALAGVAMAPVQDVLHGHDWWLRAAMALQILATGTVAFIGFRQALAEWQAYLALGVCVTILVGNFMRWRDDSGWLRRVVGTLLALAVDAAWVVLLWDRAHTASWQDATGRQVPAPAWFWWPVGMLLLSAFLLVAHLLVSPRRRSP
jgi:hypothetical protein